MKGDAIMVKLFGGHKGSADSEPDKDSEGSEDYEMSPDFEDEAIKAFPELEKDPERMMAFWKAVRACMEG